jgi:hypothetical protein
LYGSLAGNQKNVGKCGKKQYINSFYTNAGFTAFVNTALLVGHTSENGTLSGAEYLTSACNANYGTGIGCSGSKFAEYHYGYSDLASYTTCNMDAAEYVTDPLLDLNFYLDSVDCIEIYNVENTTLNVVPSYGNNNNNKNGNNNNHNNKNGNGGGVYVSAPLELLVYSTACTYMDPFGRCPDPFGQLMNYAKVLNAKPLEEHYWFRMTKSAALFIVGFAFLLLSAKLVVDERKEGIRDSSVYSGRSRTKVEKGRDSEHKHGWLSKFKQAKKPLIIDEDIESSAGVQNSVNEREISLLAKAETKQEKEESTEAQEETSKANLLHSFYKNLFWSSSKQKVNSMKEETSETKKKPKMVIVDEDANSASSSLKETKRVAPKMKCSSEHPTAGDFPATDFGTLLDEHGNMSKNGQLVGSDWISVTMPSPNDQQNSLVGLPAFACDLPSGHTPSLDDLSIPFDEERNSYSAGFKQKMDNKKEIKSTVVLNESNDTRSLTPPNTKEIDVFSNDSTGSVHTTMPDDGSLIPSSARSFDVISCHSPRSIQSHPSQISDGDGSWTNVSQKGVGKYPEELLIVDTSSIGPNMNEMLQLSGPNRTESPHSVSYSEELSLDATNARSNDTSTIGTVSFDAIMDERKQHNTKSNSDEEIEEKMRDRVLQSRSPKRFGRLIDAITGSKPQTDTTGIQSRSPLRFGRLVDTIGKSKSHTDVPVDRPRSSSRIINPPETLSHSKSLTELQVNKARSPLRFGRQSDVTDVTGSRPNKRWGKCS